MFIVLPVSLSHLLGRSYSLLYLFISNSKFSFVQFMKKKGKYMNNAQHVKIKGISRSMIWLLRKYLC